MRQTDPTAETRFVDFNTRVVHRFTPITNRPSGCSCMQDANEVLGGKRVLDAGSEKVLLLKLARIMGAGQGQGKLQVGDDQCFRGFSGLRVS